MSSRGKAAQRLLGLERGNAGPNQEGGLLSWLARQLLDGLNVPKEKARRGNRASNVSCGAWLWGAGG
jgi:hypothetical protein